MDGDAGCLGEATDAEKQTVRVEEGVFETVAKSSACMLIANQVLTRTTDVARGNFVLLRDCCARRGARFCRVKVKKPWVVEDAWHENIPEKVTRYVYTRLVLRPEDFTVWVSLDLRSRLLGGFRLSIDFRGCGRFQFRVA